MAKGPRDLLEQLRTAADSHPDSHQRFDDGGSYRIEIPSVETPEEFDEVVAASRELGIPVHRVSQGSGIGLLKDSEIIQYADLGKAANVEVCLFVGPRGPWDGVASSMTPDGKLFGWRHMTLSSLAAAYDDVARATALGIRSILIADEGLAHLIRLGKASGDLPNDLIVKASALMGVANPLGAQVIAEQGVDSINIPADSPIGEIAAYRTSVRASLDLYVESPDGLGGFLRYHEIAEIVRVGAPTYLKFGLRNAPNPYPTGTHLRQVSLAMCRERVRRASIGLEHLARGATESPVSPVGLQRPGIPV